MTPFAQCTHRNWQRLGSVAGAGLLLAAGGCAQRTLVADDAIVASGRKPDLGAYVDNKSLAIFTEGVPNAPVRFYVGGREIGEAQTDPSGHAAVPLESPGPVNRYVVRARVGDRDIEAQGTVYTWDPGRTAVAIDLDECICASEYINLIWGDGMGSRPVKGSPEAVRALAKDFQILYLSARPRFMVERTRKWLDKNGFPPGPITFADDFTACLKQAAVKKELLAQMRQKWPNIRIGIGDKYADVECCTPNDMLPVIVNAWRPKYKENAVVVRSWKDLQKFFETHRDVLTDGNRLASVIARSERLDPSRPPIPSPAKRRAPREAVAAAGSVD